MRMKIAEDARIFYRSPDPKRIFGACPNLCVLDSGRIIVTMCVFGPGIVELDVEKCIKGKLHAIEQIYISDDKGETWRHVADAPMMHARVFRAGKSVYVLGHEWDMTVMRSDDDGETWSKPVKLTEGQSWHHEAPCNVHYQNGYVYLVMERVLAERCKGMGTSIFAPVLMRGKCEDDLTRLENWTFASEICCLETVDKQKCNYVGIPFYQSLETGPNVLSVRPKRKFFDLGWSETNVVRLNDPNHAWYDSNGKTFHLFSSAYTGRSNIAAVLKVVENEDGSMTTMTENAPSGEPMVYLPFPGGSMKFYMLWDEVSGVYWLANMQASDSMSRPETLDPVRMALPCNETHRLVLHFSKNCVDWCFAGVIDIGENEKHSRYSPSMAVCGDDLLIFSRAADEEANCAHDSNLITMHWVRNFRSLIY